VFDTLSLIMQGKGFLCFPKEKEPPGDLSERLDFKLSQG